MKEQVRRICGLLKSDREEVRCAAALVLGELCDGDPGVVKVLGETLSNGESRSFKGYVLEALEKISSPSSLPFVLPLLQSDGEYREQAIRVVVGMGPGVVPKLGLVRKNSSPPERRAINQVLARVRGARATRLLLESLRGEELVAVEQTLLDVRQELRNAAAKDRKAFINQVMAFLNEGRPRDDVEAKAAALRILGYMEEPAVFQPLLRFTGPSRPSVLRRAALTALRSVPRPARGVDSTARQLFKYLHEKDYHGIVRPTLDVLYPLPCSARLLGALDELTRLRQVEVRRFALTKLGEIESKHAAEILLAFLDDGDPAIRDVAAESLIRLDASRGVVLQRLMRETRAERAWLMARILKPQAGRLGLERVAALGERVVRLLDGENRLYEPLLFLMRHASEKETRAALMRRGLRKKRSRRFEDAARTFRLLERHGLFDPEVRYELALALLKLSPRDPSRAARLEDPAIELFTDLVRTDFPLFDRLRKETVARPDELYYLGTHFVEQGNAVRELGAQILHLVMRKAPRSVMSRDAKSRLEDLGLK